MSIRTAVGTHATVSNIFWSFVTLIVFVGAFYIYFVNRTVISVAQRNAIETEISKTQAEITNLESAHIGAMNEITIELARSLGYEEAKNIVYIPQRAVSVLTRAGTIQ